MNKYNVICADPPWSYRVWSGKGKGRSAENHYSAVNVEDIKKLPIGKLADKDCALSMWITFPLLEETGEVLKAWGLKYKTVAFVQIRQNKKSDSLFWGTGYWIRVNAEICVLATKGSPRRHSKGTHQVIVSHIERHSKKLKEAKKRIEQLVGDVSKIELLARERADGWDTWGNKAPDGMSIPESEVV